MHWFLGVGSFLHPTEATCLCFEFTQIESKGALSAMPKIHKSALLATLIVFLPHGAAYASDNNRNLGGYPGPVPALDAGMGMRAEISIPLSQKTSAQRDERWNLKISAGPQMSWTSASDGRKNHRLSPLLQFSLKPQHSSVVSIAGHNLYTHWDRSVSAADRETSGGDSGVSTAGWVGIVLGAAAAVGGVILLSGDDDCVINPIGCDGPQCPPPAC